MEGLFSHCRKTARSEEPSHHPTSDQTNIPISSSRVIDEPLLRGQDSGALLDVELQQREEVGCSGQTSNNGVAKAFGDSPTNSQCTEVEVAHDPTVTENEMKTLGPDVRDPEGPTRSSDSREDNTRESGASTEELSLISEPSDGGDSKFRSEPVNWPIQLDDTQKNDSTAATETTNKSGSDWKVLERWRGQTILKMDYSRPLREGYHVYPGRYKAKTGRKTTEVAVKLFHIASSDPNWQSEIHKEVDILIKLESHSNVAKYISDGPWEDSSMRVAYIAIKMCHRKTLNDVNWSRLRDDRVRRKTQVKIYWQICSGVKHLHENGVAHLDLKPSNILFNTKETKAVISDFGISKDFEFERTESGTTMTKSTTKYGGTDGWRAAELSGSGCKAQEKKKPAFFFNADVFSLGLIGFYIFRGQRHPFQDKNVENKQNYKLWQSNIDSKKSPDLSGTESIESHLFRQMLSHEPEKRRDLKYVMGHPIFWNNCKRVGYFRDIDEAFLDLEKQEDTKWMDDGKLVLAFYEIPLDEESDDEESNSQPFEDYSVQFEVDDTGVEEKPVPEQCREPRKEKPKKGGRKTKIEETEWNNLDELEKKYEAIPEETKTEIFNLYREVIPEKFIEVEKIEENKSPKPSVRIGYHKLNSVRNLARKIRNYRTHAIDPKVKLKSDEAWELWYGRYPKFLPLLFDILPPDSIPERERYMLEEDSGDLKTLLDTAARAQAREDPTSVL